MRNARLEETPAGIKIAGRNINKLRYADNTTLMAESEEELKSLLWKQCQTLFFWAPKSLQMVIAAMKLKGRMKELALKSKFSKIGFNSTWTMNSQLFKLDFKKAEEPEIKLPTSTGSLKKQESLRKNIYFCFIGYVKTFVWITINCGKFWKRREYQTTWPASWETCMQVRKQQLELDMEQQTGSK